jgi:hypothetical protein
MHLRPFLPLANVKNIHVVNNVKYTELFSFTIRITDVPVEIFITGETAETKQDVNTAIHLVAQIPCW